MKWLLLSRTSDEGQVVFTSSISAVERVQYRTGFEHLETPSPLYRRRS